MELVDLKEKKPIQTEYRESHASPNYGQVYERTYAQGFYCDQWELIERPLLQSVLDEIRSDGASSCLDFACGTGRITKLLEEVFPEVIGVDVSATMLSHARLNCRKSVFIEQDITRESLNKKFDVITAFRFFLNAQPELRADALNAISECLDDHGHLIINVHVNSASFLGIAYRIRNLVKRHIVANTCSFEEIETYLEKAGFATQKTVWYSYLPRIGWRFPWLSRRLMLPVEKLCNWLPLIPRKSAQSFLVVAKKAAKPMHGAEDNF